MLRSRLGGSYLSLRVGSCGNPLLSPGRSTSQDQIDQVYKFNDFWKFNFSSWSADGDQDTMARISEMEEVKLKHHNKALLFTGNPTLPLCLGRFVLCWAGMERGEGGGDMHQLCILIFLIDSWNTSYSILHPPTPHRTTLNKYHQKYQKNTPNWNANWSRFPYLLYSIVTFLFLLTI